MSSKRDLVLKAFNNEKTERVPVGFWFHFAKDESAPQSDEIVMLLTIQACYISVALKAEETTLPLMQAIPQR